MTNTEQIRHLYVHVPFCAHICAYCDFAHVTYREKTADAWLQAIQKEMEHAGIPAVLETIYVGGGTPTALSNDQLEQLLSLLDPYTEGVK